MIAFYYGYMPTDTFGIIPVIIAINEGLKQFGMPSKWSIVVGWAIAVAVSVIDAVQKGSPVVPAVLTGVLLGSAASGIYDAGKSTIDFVRGSRDAK